MNKHMDHIANLKTMVETHKLSGSDVLSLESYSERVQVNSCPLIYTGALKMQDRKMTDKDIAGGGKCRTGI